MSRNQDNERSQNGNGRGDGPVETIRDGALKASIWRNEGENGPYFSTKLAKTYEDRNGDLKDAQSFSNGDLIKLSELTRRAYVRANELYREARHEYGREHDDRQNRNQRDYRESRQSRSRQSRERSDYER
ncbi:MAG: hypothetical protein AAGA09_03150 [Pseudomonadota bacterium]